MAWEREHRVTVTGVDKRQIWKIWEDVNQWHQWDTDIEYARMDGPFCVGSSFLLKPKAGPKVKIELIKVVLDAAFTDVTSFPLAKMFGIHQMKETPEGLEISCTIRVEGPLGFLWRKIVAEKVAAGLEEQAEKMVQRAREVRV